ncbi:MAG: GNAT family N-acetyltransferase, partial [Actinomycetota bacterium]|nr:GNAT family N-acetyltransferase [Actinomycetota bacterium]
LLDAIDDYAIALGLEQLHLTVRGGTGTEAFYMRHGYEHVATLPAIIRVAPGDDRDELYLIKKL